MNNVGKNNDDLGFTAQLRERTQKKANEYTELLHERQRIDVLIERTKKYVEQLNSFLVAEGQPEITLKEPRSGSFVGKPGNRSKQLPARKIEWEGMSINEIVQSILNTSPNKKYHPADLAPKIYEIEHESDLRMVIPNLRLMLQRGARAGLWDRIARANYRAKNHKKQGVLVDT
jgi:hypothetical protein